RDAAGQHRAWGSRRVRGLSDALHRRAPGGARRVRAAADAARGLRVRGGAAGGGGRTGAARGGGRPRGGRGRGLGHHRETALLLMLPVAFAFGAGLQAAVFGRALRGGVLAPVLVTFGLSVIIENLLTVGASANP